MKRIMAATAVLLALVWGSSAQPADPQPAPDKPAEKTVTLNAYAMSANDLLLTVSEQLGVRYTRDSNIFEDELQFPCWLRLTKASPARACEILSRVLDEEVTYSAKDGALSVAHLEARKYRGRPRGYDVSLLCGRYVDYINTYGQPRKPPPAPVPAEPGKPATVVEPAPERCAAAHLAELVGEVLWPDDPYSVRSNITEVGDRLVMNLNERDDALVRELLGHLTSETPGMAASAQTSLELHKKLQTGVKISVEETPLGSVLSQIAEKIGVDFYLTREMAANLTDAHVSLDLSMETPAWWAISMLGFDVGLSQGAFSVWPKGTTGEGEGYYVFEVRPLLERLAKAYERQRTMGSREGGFSGTLQTEGGVDLVAASLAIVFEREDQPMAFWSFGTRIVVCCKPQHYELLIEALKAMGWEPPGPTPHDPFTDD